ncbi:MAG: hypothetical protein FWE17_02665 [Alphaproteobacteria bacterium]|nr:hypothetical protein [Alphaproteobacteria bacterium]MCL2758558.1 hypothetical protein [Alphaproteobacteria bacterium]
MSDFKTVKDLFDNKIMKIKYSGRYEYDLVPHELINYKKLDCVGVVEAARFMLDSQNIPNETYLFAERCTVELAKKDREEEIKRLYDDKVFTWHAVFTFQIHGKTYWLERFMHKARKIGIYEYGSTSDLLDSVRATIKSTFAIKSELDIYRYDAPNFPILWRNYIKHCLDGKNVSAR